MTNPMPGPARQYVTLHEPMPEAAAPTTGGPRVEQLPWWPADGTRQPDMDMTVLCLLADGEVWQGFLDADGWRDATHGDLFGSRVVCWSDPRGPQL